MRREVEPVFTALSGSKPSALLLWMSRSPVPQLLESLATGSGPITHESLDDLTPSKAVRFLRAVLVAHGVLADRDEFLARFERWLEPTLQRIEDTEDRRDVRNFARWFLLRRLRRRSTRRHLSHGQIARAQSEIRASIRLLGWLHDQGTTLASCTQSHIDNWLASNESGRHEVRNFLVWSVSRDRAHGISIPPRTSFRGTTAFSEPDQRWQLSRRLLHSDEFETVDRVAGCLVLLYGQPCTRISQLTTDQVTDTGQTLHLSLGTRPIEIPEPLSTLIRELVSTRQGQAVVGYTDDHRWLFPGAFPGHPSSPARLSARLTRLGMPARPGRATALMDLAGQLPSVVLSHLLGLDIKTATLWSQTAGNTRSGYAAQVAQRALRKDQ
ncbi:hypothetical protein [Streptomyces sp. NBC_00356]|uniref:hypothetical protein n=1 Tax=Streptomyces sp. NBC_00356 TaxID=2975724 RepID=UPI002E27082F